ncbi:MAG: hypothetical protein J3K34DRAFT_429824 [Monoraphidium minutum]|nr:MAG: hypothetical protein J3K34DRAFT_429824 [Monoraphidium minutum]
MAQRRAPLLLAALVAAALLAAVHAQPTCSSSVKVADCASLRAQLDCIKTYLPYVTSRFTIKLDCTIGGRFDCTGSTLEVAGNVRLRPGAKCAGARPRIFAATNDTSGPALIVVRGPRHAALEAKGIDIALGGGRGGIAAHGAALVKLTAVGISGGAAAMGGALLLNDTAVAALSRGSMTGNAAGSGGAIAVITGAGFVASKAPVLTIAGTKFSGNAATGPGGVLYIASQRRDDNPSVVVKGPGAEMTSSTAGTFGGAIYAVDSRVSITGLAIKGCKAALGGGAIAALTTRAFEGGDAAPVLRVGSSTLSDNSAASGGALHLNDTRALVRLVTASRNSATEGGGFAATRAERGGRALIFEVQSSRIEGNQAGTDGGAILAQEVPVTMSASTVVENKASLAGGALHVTTRAGDDSAAATISGSILRRNKAGGDGGAAAVVNALPGSNPTPYVELRSSTVSDNACGGRGGALFLQDIRGRVDGGFMSSNSATGSAGATAANATGTGGAVCVHATAGYAFTSNTLEMSSVTLNANSAALGGAVFLLKDSARKLGVAATGCKWTDNSAIGTGPGSVFASLDQSAGGEQLRVDLSGGEWAGADKEGAVCGLAAPPPVTAASVWAAAETLVEECGASTKAECNHFCLSIV